MDFSTMLKIEQMTTGIQITNFMKMVSPGFIFIAVSTASSLVTVLEFTGTPCGVNDAKIGLGC